MSSLPPDLPPTEPAATDPAGATGPAPASPSQLWLGIGSWNYYFIVKLLLFWRGAIDFHPLENLAFAACLLLPTPTRAWRLTRQLLAPPVAISLLYYDSWLPGLDRVLSQASLLTNFSAGYLLELLGRFINLPTLAALILAIVLAVLIGQRLRLSVFVVGGMTALLLSGHHALPPAGANADEDSGLASFDTQLEAFFAGESKRSVSFPAQRGGDQPFDLIFLHICSLSWDDLEAMGLTNHPLWQRFDLLFTRFNSASSYSGPAAIRIQRAACGQSKHSSLYQPVSESCYLMSGLRQAGFEPALLMNHDGHFDDFLQFIQAQGAMRIQPMPIGGLPVAQRAFDDSPIYGDLAVLERWLETRARQQTPRVAAYYNTVSLHDGNRISGQPANVNTLTTYRLRLVKLLDELDEFFTKLEKSGRRAVVVLVPEHGAAVRGDAMQIAGLREIPSPAITLVPVGVKVIGPDSHRNDDQQRITAPSSFLAMSEVVARMLGESPYTAAGFSAANYAKGLPTTPFVAENEGIAILQRDGQYFWRQGKNGWKPYTAGAAAVPGEAAAAER
jgi:cellulose synthase operon protein YhjU